MAEWPQPPPPARAGTEDQATWYKDAIIYELHVRAFRDSNADGMGDFAGLIEKLDYVARLGVTAIWLLPFYPSPLRDDGYDIADYYGVHASYGRLADVRRLVKEAHARGLRVITELVCNHTSDQHRWFRRARLAKPGSAARDYYVWSDTDQRYSDVRIIFKDTETSNWSWDPVAQAYYWHRFYSHQPDLNFDSPNVRREIFKVVDHWLDMGIDGLRLDAIPYLYEREGTNGENLPESHRFLKELRAHVDARYQNRMLLAEANQWPEDAVAYFGDGEEGDECHMAFHFPVMPRLFMGLRMEDRFPIIDILAQTPPIPSRAQWALFLRNHDELTLEMVTDEERDYMLWAYTQDTEARLNLGIRRRLAPLLGNNRRRIELMNALLFSLPGTPVLYYGDEIGMGDNIYLGDRNGVRTPMQWSGDRNAGFSSGNRQRLYLPVIMDPEYHYESVNVEAQEANPQSLLNWMKRLIRLRKRYQAFGRGSIEFLHPENRKVLAFVRQHGEERILVVANLSRFSQFAQLDLSSHGGLMPRELFGSVEFPAVGDQPYPVMLGPHAFYWFALEPQPAGLIPTPPAPLSLRDSDLQRVLPAYLAQQRWFGARSRKIKEVEIVDTVPIAGAFLKVADVAYQAGESETYAIPLCVNEEGEVVDALSFPAFNHLFLEAIARRRRFRGFSGDVITLPTPHLARLRSSDEDLAPRLSTAEQTNNSVMFGERLTMKLFRKVEDGLQPDLEMSRFLTEAGFPNIAVLAGSAVYRRDRRRSVALAMLQAYVPNQGDAWSHALRELAAENGVVERYRPLAELLGKRTAELHLTLASRPDDPAFAPEPTLTGDARSVYQSIRSLAAQVLPMVRLRLDSLDDTAGGDAELLLEFWERLQERVRQLLVRPITARRIRCHGDYHLGQVLFTGGDFVIIDFEGEPARPLRERRLKRWAMKDVAGMLRSFAYAGLAAQVSEAEEWVGAASQAFLDAYLETARGASFLPRDDAERDLLLDVMLIEKALYELRYELDHRPEWVYIPLRGLANMVSR